MSLVNGADHVRESELSIFLKTLIHIEIKSALTLSLSLLHIQHFVVTLQSDSKNLISLFFFATIKIELKI